MKKIFQLICIVCLLAMCVLSCKKDLYITSADAFIRLSEDTLHFDTVFTKLGSTTQYVKLFNANDQKLKISSLQLMGGAASFFKLNVDGVAGTSFSNIDIEANDSMYMFVSVTINPTITNLPFIVRDSIKIEFNGNIKWLQLEAFGKSAHYMTGVTIATNTTLPNDLPIVILDSLVVNKNVILTIPQGTSIYVHPNAPIIINGTLNAVGDSNAKIVFQGIRIDDPYKYYPGGWPGLYFGTTSKNNFLKYCVFKNGYQGVALENPAANGLDKLVLEQCILDNIYDKAILCVNSSCKATNCLISNAGFGLYVVSGGSYNFNHCTFTSISNYYLSHKEALITLANCDADKKNASALLATINNSIIYGEGGFVDDEITYLNADGTPFSVDMKNVLYKQKTALLSLLFSITDALPSTANPMFDSIDISKRYYNFRLQNNSPCINNGKLSTPIISTDLDGKPRNDGMPDIGCYEK